jgi:hypothetical protein
MNRVRLDPELEHIAIGAPRGGENVPLEADVVCLRRREGGEVVRATQGRGARVERVEVDPVWPVERGAALVRAARAAHEDAVAVGATARVAARVEP